MKRSNKKSFFPKSQTKSAEKFKMMNYGRVEHTAQFTAVQIDNHYIEKESLKM